MAPRPGGAAPAGPGVNPVTGMPDSRNLPTGGQRAAQRIERFYGPDQLLGEIQKLFQGLQNNPFFQSQMRNVAQTGSQFESDLNRRLGAAGAGDTGIGATVGALGNQYTSGAQTQLRGQQFQMAMEAAIQNLLARLGQYPGLAQGMQPPDRLGQILGSAGSVVGAIPGL